MPDSRIDTNGLADLDRRLTAVGRAFDTRLMGKALKESAKPLLDIARQEVPVGRRVFKSTLRRRTKTGKTRRDSTYDQGGATKRSLRIRSVPGIGSQVAQVLVGVSKSRGKAGWRTHLITRPNIHRAGVDDFLSRTETRGMPLVESNLLQTAQSLTEKTLRQP